jgi:hypothetical protein
MTLARPRWATRAVARALWHPQTSAPVWLGAMVGLIFVVAIVVVALAPRSWQSWIVADQQTDASVAMIVTVWLHNFALCAVLLLVGAGAHASRRNGHVRGTRALLVVATVLQVRHAAAIGLVGGLDPRWLLQASAWWVLEFAALAIAAAAMWRAWDNADSAAAARILSHAVLVAGVILVCASVVEIAAT